MSCLWPNSKPTRKKQRRSGLRFLSKVSLERVDQCANPEYLSPLPLLLEARTCVSLPSPYPDLTLFRCTTCRDDRAAGAGQLSVHDQPQMSPKQLSPFANKALYALPDAEDD